MNFKQVVVRALLIQFLMGAASLPFLLWWRIPYPLLGMLGNLLHPFFLTPFLVLCSLLFCAALLGLPCAWLSNLVAGVATLWDHILDAPLPAYWIPLKPWHLIPVVSVIVGGTIYFAWQKNRPKTYFAFALIATMNTTALLIAHATAGAPVTILRRREACLVCIPDKHGNIEIVDHGYIKHAGNVPKLIHYTLAPHILFTYGEPKKITLHGSTARIKQAKTLLQQSLS